MSYYNTQTNPQQNPQFQQNSPHNRAVSSQAQVQGGFGSFMQGNRRPQVDVGMQKNRPEKSTYSEKQTPQKQNPQQGWQPRSPVNANGTINPAPVAFGTAYQPPPAMALQRTASTTGGTQSNPLWGNLRTQQNASPSAVPEPYKAISQSYQQNLGRPGSLPEWQNWEKNPDYAKAISESPEALDWKQQQGQPQQAPNPFANLGQYNPMDTPEYMENIDYNGIRTPGMYDVFRPESYQYGGALGESLNPYAQGTQSAFNQLSGMPLGLPVDMLKSQQNELANEMYQGNAATGMQRAAASGTVNGGMAEKQRQMMMDERNQSILGSHRDIDIENAYAERDNAGKLAELGNTLSNSYNSRANLDEGYRRDAAESGQNADINFQDFLSGQYNDALAGSQFELDRNNSMSDHGQGIWDTLNDNYFSGRQQNLQDFLGTEGMRLDRDEFGEQQGQNKFGNIMDLLGFMEDQRQFNSGHKLDTKKFGLDSKNSALNAALKRRDQDINLLDFFGEG
jgi:hypothetical protein